MCYKRRKSRACIVHRIVLILEIIRLALGAASLQWMQNENVSLDSKTLFRSDRAVPRRGGGVALYVKSLLMPTRLEIDATPSHVLKW